MLDTSSVRTKTCQEIICIYWWRCRLMHHLGELVGSRGPWFLTCSPEMQKTLRTYFLARLALKWYVRLFMIFMLFSGNIHTFFCVGTNMYPTQALLIFLHDTWYTFCFTFLKSENFWVLKHIWLWNFHIRNYGFIFPSCNVVKLDL